MRASRTVMFTMPGLGNTVDDVYTMYVCVRVRIINYDRLPTTCVLMHIHRTEKQTICVYVSPHIESIQQWIETATQLTTRGGQ